MSTLLSRFECCPDADFLPILLQFSDIPDAYSTWVLFWAVIGSLCFCLGSQSIHQLRRDGSIKILLEVKVNARVIMEKESQ